MQHVSVALQYEKVKGSYSISIFVIWLFGRQGPSPLSFCVKPT